MKTGIEWQVTSIELSKKLKELGVPQKSLFVWCKNRIIQRNEEGFCFGPLSGPPSKNSCYKNGHYSAFTSSELGEMLKCDLFIHGYWLQKRDCFDLNAESADRQEIIWEERATTEVDVRAKMLIYLIKNNLLDVKSL